MVDIVNVYLDARPKLLEAAIQGDADGIVIDGLGRGHVPPDWMPSIVRATDAGIPLVVCTSTAHGPVYQSYDFSGSLHEMETAGAIGVSGLNARKARLRLTVLLSHRQPLTRQDILNAFSTVRPLPE